MSLHYGVLLGSAMIFISSLGSTVTFPFLQSQRDTLQCDALCYGSMQSMRSGLSIIGTVLVGRMSDRYGRSCSLWIGTLAAIISFAINIYSTNMQSLWIAMIPTTLLNHNFSVFKALFADYGNESGYSESERASALGRLGMAVGIAFMVGPIAGSKLFSGYVEANIAAIVMTIISSFLLFLLPTPSFTPVRRTSNDGITVDGEDAKEHANTVSTFSVKDAITSFVYLPAIQSPGAKLLVLMRFGMGLAFNVFITVWTVSLKSRFNFGPTDHAYFMGWIGLWYSLSQGFIARLSIRMVGENPTGLLLVCVLFLSFGRVAVMLTTSLYVVYALMATVIIALGVMNTAMNAACSHLAGKDQVGGLYGVMDAAESIAGLVGPALGGVLYSAHPQLPIVTVVVIYWAIFAMIRLYYYDHVVRVAATINVHSKEKQS